MGQSAKEKAMMIAIKRAKERKEASMEAKKFKKIDDRNVNDLDKDEVKLIADNTSSFHRQVIEPNVKNIERRMKRGAFVKNFFINKPSVQSRIGIQAIEASGLKESSFSGTGILNMDTRRAIGKSFAEDIVERAGDELRDERPRTAFLIKRHEGESEEHQKSMENIRMMMEKTR